MPFHTATDGTRLFHLDVGDGPPVLLVHAWSLSSAMWEYQVRALVAAGFRRVAMDRRGHGRSDVPGTGYDIDTLADDLAGLVEHLDLRELTVVAHSMGTCEVTRWLGRPATDRVARAAFLGSMTPHLAGAVGEAVVDAMAADLVADRPRWFHDGAPGYFATDGTGSGCPECWSTTASANHRGGPANATSSSFTVARYPPLTLDGPVAPGVGGTNMGVPLHVTAYEPGRRLELTIDPGQVFAGTLVWEIEPLGPGRTLLRQVSEGRVRGTGAAGPTSRSCDRCTRWWCGRCSPGPDAGWVPRRRLTRPFGDARAEQLRPADR